MQRKLLVVVLALSVVGLVGCGSNSEPRPTPPVPSIQPLPTTTTTPQPPVTTLPSAETTTAQPPVGQADPACEGGGWTTGLRQDTTLSSFDLYRVRFASHNICDRVVFDIDGPSPVGYYVNYAQLTMDGSGEPVYVEGKAVIQVVIGAWQRGVDADAPVFQARQWLLRDGKHQGYEAVRSIRFANCHEGQCTIGIGVASKGLEYRVQMFPGENGSDARIVVDIAHP